MKRLLHLINEVSLGWLIAALTATVVAFALVYYWLAHIGAGLLLFTFDTAARPNLLDALYFSIVTISSLGYGDIRPVGITRLVVGTEVVLGLSFFGLLVAKISSVKQDYILRSMYADLVDDKLAKFSARLDEARLLFRNTSQMLLDGDLDPELTTTFRRETPGATFFSQYRQLLDDTKNLMVAEAHNNALFGVIDDSRIVAVYDDLRGMLRRTVMLWDRDSQAACDLVLCDNGDDLARICDLAEKLAQLGSAGSRNADVIATCREIVQLTARILAEVLPAI